MIGARDVAFPRLNALVVLDVPVRRPRAVRLDVLRAAEAGWFSYVPLSARSGTRRTSGQDAWIFMVHLTGLRSIIGAINFIATIHNMRAPGMGWGRLPLFVWTILIYAYLIVVALTSLAATVTMLLLDRQLRHALLRPGAGRLGAALAAPVLVLRPHPEVYILVLPAFGVFSEILPVFARKPIFGYKAIARRHGRHRLPRHARVGAPHVRRRRCRRVVLAFFMLSSFIIAVPDGREDLQLARHAVARHGGGSNT